MKLMNFTFRTVSLDFFWNVHGIRPARIKETYTFLYFITFLPKKGFINRLKDHPSKNTQLPILERGLAFADTARFLR